MFTYNNILGTVILLLFGATDLAIGLNFNFQLQMMAMVPLGIVAMVAYETMKRKK